MLPILHLGPLAIQLPGLILLVGLWLGLTQAEKSAVRIGIPPGPVYTAVLVAILTGLAAARVAYALRYLSVFLASPAGIISLNPGLLDPTAGVFAAAVASLATLQRYKMPIWKSLDALTPLFAVLAVSIGLAHLAAGSAYGRLSSVPWSIDLWGAKRHPSQLYEILAAVGVAVLTYPGLKTGARALPAFDRVEGLRFLAFTALTAASRLFLEAFRGDSVLILGGLRSAQLAAWVVLGFSLLVIGKRITASTEYPHPPAAASRDSIPPQEINSHG